MYKKDAIFFSPIIERLKQKTSAEQAKIIATIMYDFNLNLYDEGLNEGYKKAREDIEELELER